MPIRVPSFQPERWNNLNTTTGLFLLNSVLTAFTCGVILGIVLACGFRGETEISARAVDILEAWLMFLATMWGIDAHRFGVKRKTHQPGGVQDAPPARPSVPVDAGGGA